jgi:hypothetical protein
MLESAERRSSYKSFVAGVLTEASHQIISELPSKPITESGLLLVSTVPDREENLDLAFRI